MKKVFVQKRGLNYRRHTLYDDRIVVEMKSIRKIEKYDITIDELGTNVHYQADNTLPKNVLMVLCLLVPVVLTIVQLLQSELNIRVLLVNYVCWFGLAALTYFSHHQDDIFLTGGERNLVFYRNLPSELEVLNFIDLITETAKNFTKSKYIQFDENTDEDEYYARLTWLKDSEIITQEEFEEYKIDFEIKRLF